MQTTRYFVRAFIEFTAGMQYGHNHFECRAVLFGVHIHGDTTTIVLYDDRVVFADSNFDVGTIASQGFVDRVVYCFVNQMVQTLFADIANVHGGALAHSFKSFEHLYVTGAIGSCTFVFCFFHIEMLVVILVSD